ncbi:MAG: fibronectin type III domain-containing protein, partial [Firmicutes bacterium]|nr:fibronectin type III domain-containing protein [Bacillota bacterium]
TDNVTNSGSAAADNATTSADLSNTTSTSNGTTTATVDKTTADKIVDKAVENKSTEVVIDATANTTTAANSTTVAQVTIPTETLGAIAEKTEADVTIKTDVAEVKMDNAAAAAVSEQATGDTVQIVAEKVAEETDKVEFELKVVCSDGKVISDFKGGNIAVTVALPKAMAEKKVVCVYIDDNGHMSKVEGQKNADGTYIFFTGHFSTYAILAEEEADAVIAEQTEAIKNIEIKVSTKLDATKAGKKGIKVTWKTADGKKLDGVEFFRSVKKNSGYGKKAFFTSKKAGTTGYYLNTKSLKKGTRYYYRVRGYVLVDGQKVYTDWSNKGIRTFK